MIGAERAPESRSGRRSRRPRSRSRRRRSWRAGCRRVPRLPPAPMISTVSPFFSSATLNSRFQAVGTWRITTAASRKSRPCRHVDGGAGGHADQLGEAALPLDAHHAFRAGVARAILRADIERHAAGGRDAVADLAARHAGADRVDDAGAVDAGDERQHRPAEHLLAGAQAHVEHAVDGRGMDADAHLARARLRVGHVLIFRGLRAGRIDESHWLSCRCVVLVRCDVRSISRGRD